MKPNPAPSTHPLPDSELGGASPRTSPQTLAGLSDWGPHSPLGPLVGQKVLLEDIFWLLKVAGLCSFPGGKMASDPLQLLVAKDPCLGNVFLF